MFLKEPLIFTLDLILIGGNKKDHVSIILINMFQSYTQLSLIKLLNWPVEWNYVFVYTYSVYDRLLKDKRVKWGRVSSNDLDSLEWSCYSFVEIFPNDEFTGHAFLRLNWFIELQS